jgi:hypothetical protein
LREFDLDGKRDPDEQCFCVTGNSVRFALKGDDAVDTNKAAQQQAEADHRSGQSAPNTSNWDYSARNAYESQRDWLKQQEEAKKNS